MRAALLALSLAALSGCAALAPVPVTIGPYEVVQQAPGKTQAQIHDRARLWLAQNLGNSNYAAVQIRDRAAGMLVTNAVAAMPVGAFGTAVDVRFSMQVEAREGRYRVTATNLTYADGVATGRALSPDAQRRGHRQLDALVEDLHAFVLQAASDF